MPFGRTWTKYRRHRPYFHTNKFKRYGRKRYSKAKSADMTFRAHGWAVKNLSSGQDFYCAEYCNVVTGTQAADTSGNIKPLLFNANIRDVPNARALASQFQQHKIVDYEVTALNCQILTGTEAPTVLDASPAIVMAAYPNQSQLATGLNSPSNMLTMRNAIMKRVTPTTPLTCVCMKPVCNIAATGTPAGTSTQVLKNEWCSTSAPTAAAVYPNYTGILMAPIADLAAANPGNVLSYQVVQKYKVYFRQRLLNGPTPPSVDISDPTTATADEDVDAHCEMEGSQTHPLGVESLGDYALDMYTDRAIATDMRFNHWVSNIWTKLGFTKEDWMGVPHQDRKVICAKVNRANKLKRALMEQAEAE
eukprot:TRINITY_DN25158_c0_g1_i1.p1 TRINITY_DN25158_c0_g1~~TRINITY_DN25158_c0_g1_i1.p1  ORF type:complete len:362 (-),score=-19.72 TRINITY_DN25158_c0_g1_i1:1880-2965(-)